MILGTTDAPEGPADPIDWAELNDHDRDIDWLFGDESGSYSDNESFTSDILTTSEELEFSAGSDYDSDVVSLLDFTLYHAIGTEFTCR